MHFIDIDINATAYFVLLPSPGLPSVAFGCHPSCFPKSSSQLNLSSLMLNARECLAGLEASGGSLRSCLLSPASGSLSSVAGESLPPLSSSPRPLLRPVEMVNAGVGQINRVTGESFVAGGPPPASQCL